MSGCLCARADVCVCVCVLWTPQIKDEPAPRSKTDIRSNLCDDTPNTSCAMPSTLCLLIWNQTHYGSVNADVNNVSLLAAAASHSRPLDV